MLEGGKTVTSESLPAVNTVTAIRQKGEDNKCAVKSRQQKTVEFFFFPYTSVRGSGSRLHASIGR